TSNLPFQRAAVSPDLHTFPTRRSSDLTQLKCAVVAGVDPTHLSVRPTTAGVEFMAGTHNSAIGSVWNRNRICNCLHGVYADSNEDRKSTRLNSSHRTISYAVFCLKKKI